MEVLRVPIKSFPAFSCVITLLRQHRATSSAGGRGYGRNRPQVPLDLNCVSFTLGGLRGRASQSAPKMRRKKTPIFEKNPVFFLGAGGFGAGFWAALASGAAAGSALWTGWDAWS